jgi:hypothetical protein
MLRTIPVLGALPRHFLARVPGSKGGSMRGFSWLAIPVVLSGTYSYAQTLSTRPTATGTPAISEKPADTSVDLTVPSGTPIKIALDQEVKIKKVGQPVHGRVVEPVFAFDKEVVPRGTEAIGTISQIDDVSKTTRTLAAMNANFSPARSIHVTFTELIFADGRHLPIATVVSPASSGVLEFVAANNKKGTAAADSHPNAISRNVSQGRAEAKRQWDTAMNQLHEPGKMHKIKRMAEAELPYHGQYLDAGTSFDADLKQPLQFGSEQVKPETLAKIASVPPNGGVVHARLVTPLNSASATKGEPVEALITEPLKVSDQLLLPVGTRVTGSVLEVRPARRLKHNGQLRIIFHEVELPNGLQQKIESNIEGVEVSKGENLALDAEGGAQVTSPRTRYFTTAIQVALATQVAGDRDAGKAVADNGSVGSAAASGASGFRLAGAIVTAAAHSRLISSGFGIYGAGMAVYTHFLARGNDVVYPKDMSMVIGLGTR